MRLFAFGGYGLALAALALVDFGAYDSYPKPPRCDLTHSVRVWCFFNMCMIAAVSSPHLDQNMMVLPPYDGRGSARHPGSHHTLPHQRHHPSARQSNAAPSVQPAQRSASQHHFTLPRPHQQPIHQARR